MLALACAHAALLSALEKPVPSWLKGSNEPRHLHHLRSRARTPPPRAPSTAHMCDGAIVDIKSFMQQVRRAKAAIRAALEKEGGIVSEDMECVVEGLHTVNPTAPNPAADIDLWAGDFELLTHNFGSICTSRSRLVKISEEGAIPSDQSGCVPVTINAELDCRGMPICMAASGALRIRSPDVLLLSLSSVRLSSGAVHQQPQAERQVCEDLCSHFFPRATLSWNVSASHLDCLSQEDSPLLDVELTQLYLDQDLHIMRPSRCLGKLVVLGRPVSS